MMLIFIITTHRLNSILAVNSKITYSLSVKRQQSAAYIWIYIKLWTAFRKEFYVWTVIRFTRHDRKWCAKFLKAFFYHLLEEMCDLNNQNDDNLQLFYNYNVTVITVWQV